MTEPMTLAVPNKGRLKEPSIQLLRDAGLSFEITERALSIPVANGDLELLLVRTEDVPEMVHDGAADLGITGVDLLEEYGDGLPVLAELNFGHCRLAAAVPNASTVETLPDLDGLRVATAHPKTTSRYLASHGIGAEIVALRGSVEVAPKIGVADAIVDLVSSGSTLRVNGLRSVGTILESQAVLVGRADTGATERIRRVAIALQAVVAGRRKRYLLLNAPAATVDSITRLIPGLEAPTLVPLAEEGWMAIHSVVDAEHLWELLPRLEAAGGRGILVLRIEQLIP